MSKLHNISCQRLLKMDAGHRVVGHEGKCGSVHGHEYFFEVFARRAESLDNLGRVIDFSVIKDVVGKWIDVNWDHGMILWKKDEILSLWKDEYLIGEETVSSNPLYGQKYFPLPTNPTAENLASYLLDKSNELLKDKGVEVWKVICHETSNCSATAEK